MAQSLFSACKSIVRNGISGTQDVGGHSVFFELYTQEDINNNVAAIARGEASGCTFGSSDESRVVLVAGDTITIPDGFTLTPAYPKKSLVILANTLINDGTISMTGKAPNVLPHDLFLLGTSNGYSENIVISAYANNGLANDVITCAGGSNGHNGSSGTGRKCGSGGTGAVITGRLSTASVTFAATGSGYAFGGGAGCGGVCHDGSSVSAYAVDSVYTMRGTSGYIAGNANGNPKICLGGSGNPHGEYVGNSVGWFSYTVSGGRPGGRVVVFCTDLSGSGTFEASGQAPSYVTDVTYSSTNVATGGSPGGGAIDIFYKTSTISGESCTAEGGQKGSHSAGPQIYYGGLGGDGCVTLEEFDLGQIIKERQKYMSKNNMIYFLGQLVSRMED